MVMNLISQRQLSPRLSLCTAATSSPSTCSLENHAHPTNGSSPNSPYMAHKAAWNGPDASNSPDPKKMPFKATKKTIIKVPKKMMNKVKEKNSLL